MGGSLVGGVLNFRQRAGFFSLDFRDNRLVVGEFTGRLFQAFHAAAHRLQQLRCRHAFGQKGLNLKGVTERVLRVSAFKDRNVLHQIESLR